MSVGVHGMHCCAAAVADLSGMPICCFKTARPAVCEAHQAEVHSWCGSEPKHLRSMISIANASQKMPRMCCFGCCMALLWQS